MAKKNIYTVLKKAAKDMKKGPHKDTGNNNIYAVMGFNRKKEKEAKENKAIKKKVKNRVDSVKKNTC